MSEHWKCPNCGGELKRVPLDLNDPDVKNSSKLLCGECGTEGPIVSDAVRPSKAEIVEMRELIEKAADLPWMAGGYNDVAEYAEFDENLSLMMRAVNELPYLLDRIEELTKEVEKLKGLEEKANRENLIKAMLVDPKEEKPIDMKKALDTMPMMRGPYKPGGLANVLAAQIKRTGVVGKAIAESKERGRKRRADLVAMPIPDHPRLPPTPKEMPILIAGRTREVIPPVIEIDLPLPTEEEIRQAADELIRMRTNGDDEVIETALTRVLTEDAREDARVAERIAKGKTFDVPEKLPYLTKERRDAIVARANAHVEGKNPPSTEEEGEPDVPVPTIPTGNEEDKE